MILEKSMISGIFGKKIIDKKIIKIMKIFVLGKSGMLGRYVFTYFQERDYEVVGIGRNELDVASCDENIIKDVFSKLSYKKGDVVINCAGTIKPRVDELGSLNAIKVNAVFPYLLANVSQSLGIKCIHPTTDCVFSGSDGEYDEDSAHDVTDVYGRSKSLGEPTNCTVIRTSIIGEEVNDGRSLVEWIKSRKNQDANGFLNHKWNGITCLQFAKVCEEIIKNNLWWDGVKHIHSPDTVNKLELLSYVSEVYDLNIEIVPTETPNKCDRSLSSIYDINIDIPYLKDQIIEMKEFNNQLRQIVSETA